MQFSENTLRCFLGRTIAGNFVAFCIACENSRPSHATRAGREEGRLFSQATFCMVLIIRRCQLQRPIRMPGDRMLFVYQRKRSRFPFDENFELPEISNEEWNGNSAISGKSKGRQPCEVFGNLLPRVTVPFDFSS